MEYKTHKRTKSLTLRDIHVGDWVQVWSELTERYSPPLKIIQICDDGTIYLVTDDEERCTPWEENIKDIDALPITTDLLRGFGFKQEYNGSDIYRFKGISINVKRHYLDCLYGRRSITYFHEMQNLITKNNINFEWKGIEK